MLISVFEAQFYIVKPKYKKQLAQHYFKQFNSL